MTLTLVIENAERLDNGEPTQLKLDRHGAVIGRSPHSDWSLPDPKNYISSTHCEIDYRNGAYLLFDKSTNGTFVNNGAQRLDGPHVLKDGDIINVGHYRIVARTQAGAKAAAPPPEKKSGGWDGWGDGPAAPAPTPSSSWDTPAPAPVAPPAPPTPAAASTGGWGGPAPAAPSSGGWGDPPPSAATPVSSSWASPAGGSGWATPAPAHQTPPHAAPGWDSPPPSPAAPPTSDAWGAAGARPPGPSVSGWDDLASPRAAPDVTDDWGQGSAISGRGAMSQNWTPPQTQAAAPSPWTEPAAAGSDPADVWGAFAASNHVDWSRGGFGADPAPAPAAFTPPPQAAPAAPTAPPSQDGEAWSALLRAGGLDPASLKGGPVQAAETAGRLLKSLLAGLVVMMEARARAKAQLGAQSTTLELNGNNPLKFARSPDRVLAQMLNPPERGFMTPDQAIEDSFQDLQAHQMATLAAMQGALRSTLERFSPEAIRQRAEMRGVLARILPAARNATLWETYEREFEGVARGSDEAFMDVFAKAFKQAYEQAAANMKRGGRS